MKHITVDELIDFVSFDKIDPKSLENASKVTTHIRCCETCLGKVRAFQLVHDEMKAMGTQSMFREIAREVAQSHPAFAADGNAEPAFEEHNPDK